MLQVLPVDLSSRPPPLLNVYGHIAERSVASGGCGPSNGGFEPCEGNSRVYRVELHVSVSLTIGQSMTLGATRPIWVTRSVHQQQPPTTKCTEPSPPPLAMNGKENPLIVNALPHRLADCAIALWHCCSPERQRERSQGNHYNSTIVCNWMDGGGVFATHGPTAPSLPLLLPPTNNPIHPSSISSSSQPTVPAARPTGKISDGRETIEITYSVLNSVDKC